MLLPLYELYGTSHYATGTIAPSSLTSQKKDWHKIYSAENAIRSSWSFRDKEKMQENIERLWSEALGIAYFNATPITGDPFDALEEKDIMFTYEVQRCAGSLQLTPNTKGLQTWIQRGERVLGLRENGSSHRDLEKNNFLAVADLWTDTNHYSDSVVYMATSRRPTHKDVHIDMILLILEGAAKTTKRPIS